MGGPGYRSGTRQDRGIRAVTPRSQARRDAVRPLETHPEAWPAAAAWPPRRTGRVHAGGDRPEPTPAGQAHRAAAASCRHVYGVAQRHRSSTQAAAPDRASGGTSPTTESPIADVAPLVGDFYNKIGTFRPKRRHLDMSHMKGEADPSPTRVRNRL